jgi:hypothetical protein
LGAAAPDPGLGGEDRVHGSSIAIPFPKSSRIL